MALVEIGLCGANTELVIFRQSVKSPFVCYSLAGIFTGACGYSWCYFMNSVEEASFSYFS